MMEVLQCDGCDFRAESHDDLKAHIQEVHTAFLQPADADESDSLRDEDDEEEEEEGCEDNGNREDNDYTALKDGMSMSITTNVTVRPLKTHMILLVPLL